MIARTHVDLFSGIGGFALAAQANDVQTVSFCEIDERCRDFLAKAWPGVDIHDDVRTFDGLRYRDTTWLLTAGVPCQPASRAGKQRGSDDNRWLWPEAIRVLSAVRPTWALFENPPGIGDVGLAGILSDVAAVGYEARVFGIPACAVGAPHRRERYWIVCHRTVGVVQDDANIGRRREDEAVCAGRTPIAVSIDNGNLAHTGRIGGGQDEPRREQDRRTADRWTGAGELADASGAGLEKRAGIGRNAEPQQQATERGSICGVGQADAARARRDTQGADDYCTTQGPRPDARQLSQRHWNNAVYVPCADGKFRRAPDDTFGLVDGLHRSILGALGNSIVPAVAERIIAAMIEAEQ